MSAPVSAAPAPVRPGGRSLRSQIVVLVVVSALVIVIGGAVILASVSTLTNTRMRIIDAIHPARIAARDLRVAMIDQETGVRGFVLTQDPAFLEPYERGRNEQTDAVARLRDDRVREVVPDDDRLATVLARIDDWSRLTAEPALDATRAGGASASSPAFQDAAKERFDAIRTAIDELDRSLDAAREAQIAELESASSRVVVVTWAVLGAFGAVLVVITVTLLRAILRPLEDLGSETQVVVGGDLDHAIALEGPTELQAVAAHVEIMREQLVAKLAEVEAARALVVAQAEELSRSNADLEQFAYVASHDLQEPLRKITGFCQLLQKRYGGQLDERADEYIFYATDGALRMQDLINDLLAFSRVGRTTERFTEVDLDDVLAQARRALATAIEEAGAVIEADPLPTVDGDARLLVAVFQNLLANAVKFRSDEAPRIRITARPLGDDQVELSFEDNGIGIDPEYADQIFVIFKRLHTRATYEGTGIGLALAKKIVEFHGGRLDVERRPPPGSTFHVVLPLRATTPATTPAPPTAAADPSSEESHASL